MLDIGTYEELIELVLGELAKYFALLLLSVLAIRFWRQAPKISGANRRKFFLFAGLTTALAVIVGYYSLCHSLGRLYSHYGMKAFTAGNIFPACALFQTSVHYWPSADALGKEGVCLLWLGRTDEGMDLIARAKALRHGRSTAFEDYYQGLHFYFQERFDQAIPLLESSSRDLSYDWNITKLFAVIDLEKNQPDEARRLMKPFAQVEVKDYDHAYVVAALALADGKTAEAGALVDRFATTNLPPFWKSRFDKLRAKIQNPPP